MTQYKLDLNTVQYRQLRWKIWLMLDIRTDGYRQRETELLKKYDAFKKKEIIYFRHEEEIIRFLIDHV